MTNSIPSPELRAFFIDWYVWATSDATDMRPHCRDLGLCSNIQHYNSELCFELKRVLVAHFPGNHTYPFNSRQSYEQETKNDTAHLNPRRLAWVAALLDETSPCKHCDGRGRSWNNADPTSGQFVLCTTCNDPRG